MGSKGLLLRLIYLLTEIYLNMESVITISMIGDRIRNWSSFYIVYTVNSIIKDSSLNGKTMKRIIKDGKIPYARL